MLKEMKVGSVQVILETYMSAKDIVDDCNKRPITDGRFENQRTISHDKSWSGVGSYEEALDLLEHGYQPNVEQFKNKLNATVQGEGKRISFKNDIVGYAPIVPLAIKGVPQSMINTTMKPIKAKVIDLYYDMTMTCGNQSSVLIENGKKILSAILKMEQEGYKINLYALQTYCEERKYHILCLKVKSSNQPLDLKRLSFSLAHTAMFRVIGFDWYSKCPKAKYFYGYGRPLGARLNDRIKRREVIRTIFNNKTATLISATEMKNESEDWLMKEIKNESGNKRN